MEHCDHSGDWVPRNIATIQVIGYLYLILGDNDSSEVLILGDDDSSEVDRGCHDRTLAIQLIAERGSLLQQSFPPSIYFVAFERGQMVIPTLRSLEGVWWS